MQNNHNVNNYSNANTSINTNPNTTSVFSSIFQQKDPTKSMQSGNIFLQNNNGLNQNNQTQNVSQSENNNHLWHKPHDNG